MTLRKKVALSALSVLAILLVSAFTFVSAPSAQLQGIDSIRAAITQLRANTAVAEIPESHKNSLLKFLDKALGALMAEDKRGLQKALKQIKSYTKALTRLKKNSSTPSEITDPLLESANGISAQINTLLSPPFSDLVIQPLRINAGSSITILAEIFVPDPALQPSSLKLERLDEAGKVISTLGNLHDDGQDGDRTAGDKHFSLKFPVAESGEGSVRLRASAMLRGFSGKRFSTEQRIIVMPLITDTTPDDFVSNVASVLLTAQDTSQVSSYFSDRSFATIEYLVQNGTTLEEIGRTFQTARLRWKDEQNAEFEITITRFTGETFSSSLILHRGSEQEEWRIVNF